MRRSEQASAQAAAIQRSAAATAAAAKVAAAQAAALPPHGPWFGAGAKHDWAPWGASRAVQPSRVERSRGQPTVAEGQRPDRSRRAKRRSSFVDSSPRCILTLL
ncbi:Protein of unknown function [Gryllus bimaculatus]|nr:Protein of unknown function [Gryllus bimaculatus]